MGDCIFTLLHECRHAYQYHIISVLDWEDENVQTGYFFWEARIFKENWDSYVPYYRNFDAYKNQPIEKDASGYAESRISVYKNFF